MTRVIGDTEEATNIVGYINGGVGYPTIEIQDNETSTDNLDTLLAGIASGFLYSREVEVG